jgi:hypothetical protein
MLAVCVFVVTAAAIHLAVILRSRALARRFEGWPRALVAHPSRLAVKNGEHLRMTAVSGERGHGEENFKFRSLG